MYHIFLHQYSEKNIFLKYTISIHRDRDLKEKTDMQELEGNCSDRLILLSVDSDNKRIRRISGLKFSLCVIFNVMVN